MTWTKSDIRAARKAELAPILLARGYRLQPAGNGNFRILPAQSRVEGPAQSRVEGPAQSRVEGPALSDSERSRTSGVEGPNPDDPSRPSGIAVKQNYWVWPESDMSGNTIEFFLLVERKTFQDAMSIISPYLHHDPSEQHLREERGNEPDILSR